MINEGGVCMCAVGREFSYPALHLSRRNSLLGKVELDSAEFVRVFELNYVGEEVA